MMPQYFFSKPIRRHFGYVNIQLQLSINLHNIHFCNNYLIWKFNIWCFHGKIWEKLGWKLKIVIKIISQTSFSIIILRNKTKLHKIWRISISITFLWEICSLGVLCQFQQFVAGVRLSTSICIQDTM